MWAAQSFFSPSISKVHQLFGSAKLTCWNGNLMTLCIFIFMIPGILEWFWWNTFLLVDEWDDPSENWRGLCVDYNPFTVRQCPLVKIGETDLVAFCFFLSRVFAYEISRRQRFNLLAMMTTVINTSAPFLINKHVQTRTPDWACGKIIQHKYNIGTF